MGYRGWHGITDPAHMVLAVSYEPIGGTLGVRFASTEEPYAYCEVPENIYQILLRSKFAGSYLRKHVIGRYQCLNPSPPKFQPKERPTPKNLKVIEVPIPETDLFGQVIHHTHSPKRLRSS